MAKKTKAELAAESAVLVAAQQAALEAEYPARLMAALELATSLSVEIKVRDNTFKLFNLDTDEKLPPLSPTYTDMTALYNLEEVEYTLRAMFDENQEQNRRYLVRQAALNKLSKEERELLALPLLSSLKRK
jgi:hypothetical protein